MSSRHPPRRTKTISKPSGSRSCTPRCTSRCRPCSTRPTATSCTSNEGAIVADDVVLTEIQDRVAVVTLNRPDARNALNRAIRMRLPAVLNELEADDGVDVMILTGADPAFCAGVDLKEFGSGEVTASGEGFAELGDGRTSFRGALPPRAKLLVGAINGVAVTGGFEVA